MSSTICSEKIHHPPCSLENSNQRNRQIHGFPVCMACLSISPPPLEKREDGCSKMAVLSDVQPFSLAVSSVYFQKYLCLISASVTFLVQSATDTLWQCGEASGQQRRAQTTLWIINGINQHLWCCWQFAETGRLLLLSALGKLCNQPGQHLRLALLAQHCVN